MRRAALAACLLLALSAPSRAAEPEGVLLCAVESGGFDCEKGACKPSAAAAGRDMRLDFAARTMCALRGAQCRDPKVIQHAAIDEEQTIVAASSADGATLLFRIAPDMKMAMVFVIGAQRVISFTGACRRATSG